MKRIIAILLAAVLTVGMVTTAFAADSQEGDQTTAVIKSVSGDVTMDEIEWTGDFTYTDDDVMAAAKDLGVDTSNAKVGLKGDLHLKSGKLFEGNAVVTFNISDVIAILHFSTKTNAWQKVGDSATGTFSDFSPVAILVKKTASGGDQKSDEKSSPATGEAPFVAGMALIAILAAAGIVISRKRSAE